MELLIPSPIVIEFAAPPGQDAATLIRLLTPEGYKFKTMDRKGSTVKATFVLAVPKAQPNPRPPESA
jgi:hypothetical protein